MAAATVSTIWYVDAPDPGEVLRDARADCTTAHALVGRLHPGLSSEPLGRVPLAQAAAGAAGRVYVGSFPGVTVVCSPDLAATRPSQLPERWRHTVASENTYLVVSDPTGARGAVGAWRRGTPRRAFDATPVAITEDDGLPFVWERPFWGGEFPIRWPLDVLPHPEALPFHPRRFAEAANAAWLGFRYTGRAAGELDPHEIEVWDFALYRDGERPPADRDAPGARPARRRWWPRRISAPGRALPGRTRAE
ncbi:DUF6928 family protein [Rhodococcus sp. SJ]|uniref:DUF6928 family protein n=1 Tax=Rhodococcus sp. SJ TaxID=3434112 RepID=UPI003D7B9BBD